MLVRGMLLPFTGKAVPWRDISGLNNSPDEYNFSGYLAEAVHSVDYTAGRIVQTEGRGEEVVGQLDYECPSGKDLWCLR